MIGHMTEARNMRLVIVAPENLTAAPEDDESVRAEAERSRMLRIALLESGFNIVATLPADVFLPERIAQIQPDMIVVDAESQGRDILEHVVVATRGERRPIVLFSDDEDTSHVRAAIASGVSAYVVAGLPSEKIKPVIDVAMARFQHEEGLRRELADARNQLEDRKVIERAKGVLMTKHGLSEQEAYGKLRKAAMDKGLKLSEVAQRLLDVTDMLA
jgi:response regulator NasT